MRILILGSKEFPMGTNVGDDILPSGGIEVYTDDLVSKLNEYDDIWPIVVTRRFSNIVTFEKKKCEIYRVPWFKGKLFRGPSFNLFSFFKAMFLKYDCVLAHGPMAGFSSILLSRIKHCKAIVRPAGIAFTQPQYPLRSFIKKFETFVFSNADYVIFGSSAEKDRFSDLFGFLPKNWKIIPTGIKPINHNKSQSGQVKIAYVGRLVKVKGVKYLIRAVRSLKQNFSLLVIGDGPEKKNLIELASEDPRIEFFGFRNNVKDILADTDVFVLPSLSEGVPLALLEAMASGCACIVTRIGLPVRHKKTGLVVDPENSWDLALAIKRLLSDPTLRKTLQDGAKQFIKENHSLDKMVRMYVELFRTCVTSRVILNSTSSKSCRH